jgi:hypothetical protein
MLHIFYSDYDCSQLLNKGWLTMQMRDEPWDAACGPGNLTGASTPALLAFAMYVAVHFKPELGLLEYDIGESAQESKMSGPFETFAVKPFIPRCHHHIPSGGAKSTRSAWRDTALILKRASSSHGDHLVAAAPR